ncbi:MAG: phage tail tape measure protein, partial [Bergeyella sp.]
MSSASTTWVLNLSENIIPKFQSMQTEGRETGEAIEKSFNRATDSLERTNKSGGKLGDCFKRIKAMDWYAVSNGIQSMSNKLSEATQPGVAFNTEMHELKALTGATDEQMQKMTSSARAMSKEFGNSGSDILVSYTNILGALGPQIAENDEALAKMGRNVQVMSKTMRGDVQGATEALNNSLIQFKVNLENPMEAAEEMDRMMNVMVASAQEGSVEVPNISKALSDAGGVAKMSNMTFEETNALLQGMAKGGVEIDKIGVAARNAILKMSAPATLSKDAVAYMKAYNVDLKKISDTTIPFAERLRELNKLGHDMNALALIFGTENVQGAQAMLNTIDYQEDLTQKVTGTSAAYEMAAENMSSWNEKMKRWRATIDDWKVSLFDATAPIIPFLQGGAGMLSVGADMANIYSGLSPVFRSLGTWLTSTAVAQKLLSIWTGVVTVAQWAWNAALTANPIGIIIVAIGALVALVAVAIKKWDDWGAALTLFLGPVGRIIAAFKSIYDHWDSIKKAFQTEGIIGGLKRLGWVLLDSLMKPFQQILE